MFQGEKIWYRMIIRKYIYSGEITEHKLKNHKKMLRQKKQKMYKVYGEDGKCLRHLSKQKHYTQCPPKKSVMFSPKNFSSNKLVLQVQRQQSSVLKLLRNQRI